MRILRIDKELQIIIFVARASYSNHVFNTWTIPPGFSITINYFPLNNIIYYLCLFTNTP